MTVPDSSPVHAQRWLHRQMVILVLAAGVSFAQPLVGPVVELDSLPNRAAGTAIAALRGRALGSWLPDIMPCCASIRSALFDADGGVTVLSATPGSGVRFAPSVIADPDAGLWLLLWPDENSGGVTGGTRVALDGTMLDGNAHQFSSTSYTSMARAASTTAGFRVIQTSTTSSVFTVSAQTGLGSTPVPAPEITSSTYDTAGVGATVGWAWVDPSQQVQFGFEVNGMARALTQVVTASAVVAATGPDQLAFLVTSPSRASLLAFSLDAGLLWQHTFTSPQTFGAPALTFDGTYYWAGWVAGSSELVLQRIDSQGVVNEQSWVLVGDGGVVSAPSLAALTGAFGWVLWNEQLDGGLWSRARSIEFSSVVDAGTDAGADAGTDAGADAGGEAGVDAGVDAGSDGAGAADAGSDGEAPPIAARSYWLGCSSSASSAAAWLVLVAVLVLRRTML